MTTNNTPATVGTGLMPCLYCGAPYLYEITGGGSYYECESRTAQGGLNQSKLCAARVELTHLRQENERLRGERQRPLSEEEFAAICDAKQMIKLDGAQWSVILQRLLKVIDKLTGKLEGKA